MDFDDLLLQTHDENQKRWVSSLDKDALCKFVSTYREGTPCTLVNITNGSFNACFQFEFDDDGPDWMLRMPIPGKSMFLDEKVRDEVATMKFIKAKTSIPIAALKAYGMSADNPTRLGPFIITEFVQGRVLRDLIKTESCDLEGRPDDILDPGLDPEILQYLYRQIADIQLELFKHDFEAIGSLKEGENGSWTVEFRPLSLNMNEMVRCGGVDTSLLENRVFSSTEDYMLELGKQNWLHFKTQRNAVYGEEDCILKYTSRRLCNAAIPQFLSRMPKGRPFKLHCDDFGPGNMLVDPRTLQITAVLDLEWCFAAPVQIACNPPRWLLLRKPPDWRDFDEDGPDLLDDYTPKLELYLQILKEQERKRNIKEQDSLSQLMVESFSNGNFWLHEALRDPYGFDYIYWGRLDELIHGRQQQKKKDRVSLLPKLDRQELEVTVREKMNQMNSYEEDVDSDGEVSILQISSSTGQYPLSLPVNKESFARTILTHVRETLGRLKRCLGVVLPRDTRYTHIRRHTT